MEARDETMKDVEAREMFENSKEHKMFDIGKAVALEAYSEQMFSLENKLS